MVLHAQRGLRPLVAAMLMASTGLAALVPAAGPATAQQAVRDYRIPAGPLAQALTAFGQQSGLQVSFAPMAAGLRSPGLAGPATPEAAIAQLLSGTGLDYSFPNPGTVSVTAPQGAGGAPGGFHLGTIRLYGDRTAQALEDSRASVAVVRALPYDAPAVQTRTGTFRRMANVEAGDLITSGFVIRGINSEGLVPGGAGNELVTFYVDGVQQTTEGTRLGQRGMFDVEQVEVYRGPQSTLSGRAALAGAMYLRSVDPTFERSGAVQMTVGTNGRRQIGPAFGDRINDRLAYRISGEYAERQSDIDYPSYRRFARYDDFVTDSYSALRARLLWQPFDNETTRVLFSVSRMADSPTPRMVAGPLWTGGVLDYGDRRGDIWGELTPAWAIPGDLAPFTDELPLSEELRDGRVDNFGIEVSHEISPSLRFTALTGFSRSLTRRDSINVGTPGELAFVLGAFRQRTLSQEVRLNYDDGALRWVAGLYAARLNRDGWSSLDVPPLGYSDRTDVATVITNLAVFGEASYEFSPGWRAFGGGRIDWISQRQSSVSVLTHPLLGHVVTPSPEARFRDTVFLPRVGIEYAGPSGHTVSLGYQQGYRPGGSGVRTSDMTVYDFAPETAHNLELARRGRFLEDRLRVSGNLFYQNWRNQQVEILTVAGDLRSAQIFNAGRSTSYGGELELAWAATDRLNVYASVGLLRTRFDDFRLRSSGSPTGYIDYTGLPFPGAPERTLALGFRWGEDTGWFAAGSLKYVSSRLSRIEYDVAVPARLASYTTVDVELGYGFRNGMVLTGYATNLFDREYFTYETGPGLIAALGARREIGLRLDYRF